MASDRYERVMAAMRRGIPDRVPWALWGHFPAVPFLKYYSWEKANRDGEEVGLSINWSSYEERREISLLSR